MTTEDMRYIVRIVLLLCVVLVGVVYVYIDWAKYKKRSEDNV